MSPAMQGAMVSGWSYDARGISLQYTLNMGDIQAM